MKFKQTHSSAPLILFALVGLIVGCAATSPRRFQSPPPTASPQVTDAELETDILQRSILDADILEAQVVRKKYEIEALMARKQRCTSDCEEIDHKITALNKESLILIAEIERFTKERKKQLCEMNTKYC